MKPVFAKKCNASADNGEHWLTVSDLMAGLMMVFLFIAVAYIRDTRIDNLKMKEVAIAYQQNQVEIYDALITEFAADLERWGAEIDPVTISFKFKAPDVLFEMGKIVLKPRFKEILDDFFPRYLNRLRQFDDSIDEVRIEGHTSSRWNSNTDPTMAYFKNMWLSQGRTRSVLQYVYGLPQVSSEQDWIKSNIAAVGFSSSRPILASDGDEDQESSRRVSFRVVTNADIQIRKILEE